MSQKFAFVAGTTLLDIVSTVVDNRDKRDAVGPTTLNFGGVAYNVAVNLRNLNIPVTLMTALNETPISQMIVNELNYNDIRLHIKKEPSLRDGIYSGHFLNGEEVSSVWDNILENYNFPIPFIKKGMRNAKCVVLSNCLSIQTLNNCIQIANELNIPVFVSSACLAESHKFLKLEGQIECIFCNHLEFNYLAKDRDDIETPQDFANFLKTSVVMTKSDKGVEVYTKDKKFYNFTIDAQSVTENSLGAGDLFMSAAIKHHYFEGLPLVDSVEKSLEISVSILERVDANIGRKRALEENISDISLQAERDALTRLLNRHGVEKAIKNLVQKQQKFSLILLDIDHFKSFNDTYGHDVGDQVLIKVSQVIQESVRSKDIVGRWGGEEFLSIIVSQSSDVATKIAERIRISVEKIQLEGISRHITVSGGIVLFDDKQDWTESLKKADELLYKAKESGRNKMLFE